MSLDDIWAEPVETTVATSNPEGSRGSGPSHRALFLPESEDDDAGDVPAADPRRHVNPQSTISLARDSTAPQGPAKAQLDAMFAGLDDDDDPFGDVAPAVDVEKLKRQADAEVAATRTALPSASSASLGGGTNATDDRNKEDKRKKTTRRVVPKLDEERLLGRDGFPRLLKQYKTFKVTGKGHESADLEKLFRIYHAWSHRMFPKFQFRDTVERIERLCRSRRMAVNLKVWRDEAHGITPEVRHGVLQGNNGSDSDAENENEDQDQDQDEQPDKQPAPPVPSSPSSSRPTTPVTRPSSAASTAPSVPSSATDVVDDMDIDALLREEEELMRAMDAAQTKGRSYKPSDEVEDDEDVLWAAAGGIPDGVPADVTAGPASPGPASLGEADNEDMWDIYNEMEDQRPIPEDGVDSEKAATAVASKPHCVAPKPPDVSEQPTIGADWDDMYE